MKTKNKRIPLFLVIAAIVCLFSCKQQISPLPSNGTDTVKKVPVSLTCKADSNDSVFRTIMPDVDWNAYKYSVKGAKAGGAEQELLSGADFDGLTFMVEPAEWTFTVTAYSGDTAVLSGNTTVTVRENDDNNVTITMKAVSGGSGTATVTLRFPSGRGVARVTAGVYDSPIAADSGGDVEFDNDGSQCTAIFSDSVPSAVAQFVKFFLYNESGVCVGSYVDSVYVVAGMESSDEVAVYEINMFAVSVNVRKDDTEWYECGKTITLQRDSASYTLTKYEWTGTYIASVPCGTYSIFSDGEDTGVTVTVTMDGSAAADLDFYTVTLPESVQYYEIKTESQNPIPKGKNYVFTVDVNERFVCGVPVVKANSIAVTETDGKYTVVNVTEPMEVTVETTQHEWNDGEVNDDMKTYTCKICKKTKTANLPNSDGEVSATAEDVVDVILSLPKPETYTVKVTGEIDNDTIEKIKEVLKSENYVQSIRPSLKVNLDLSGTTGLVKLVNSFSKCDKLSGVVLPNDLEIIGGGAFSECHNLATIVLPESLKSIESHAFYFCDNIVNLTLPEGLESIGSSAFALCYSLTSVTIPKSVKEISENPFENCTSLTRIIVNEENENYKSIDDKMILSKDGTVFICYPSVSGDFTIPDGVKTIGKEAFWGNMYLNTVTIPSEVETIESQAFAYCNKLKMVTLQSTIPPKLKSQVFSNKSGICVPPDSVSAYKTADGWSDYADYIIHIHVPGETESYGDLTVYTCTVCGEKSIDDGTALLFANADNVSSVIANAVGDATVVVTGEINDNTIAAIADNLKANSVTMINLDLSRTTGLTNIGRNFFNSCQTIKSINIPEGVTSIDEEAFWICKNLTTVIIPSSVIELGANPFRECENLKIFVNDKNENCYTSEDHTMLFHKNDAEVVLVCGSSALGDIEIPSGVTVIGKKSFYNNQNIKIITLPDTLTTIEDTVFLACNNLERINIPNSVSMISYWYEFTGCKKLKFFVDKGNNWFSTSEDHTMLLRKEDAETILWAAPGCSGDVTIPKGVTRIIDKAFLENSNIRTVKISDSVTKIREGAFADCDNLENVYISKSVEEIESPTFQGCSKITFTVDSENKYYSASDDGLMLLSKDKEKLIAYPSAFCDVKLPDYITSMGDGAFYTVKNLITISLPNKLKTIPISAFYNCNALEKVIIPDSVECIEEGAFNECHKLKSIVIPKNVKQIGIFGYLGIETVIFEAQTPPIFSKDNVFMYCSNLKHIYVPSESITAYRTAPSWSTYANLITAGSIVLDKNQTELWSGETIQLSAEKNPPSATGDVVWTSDDTSIATVSDTGLVTATDVGTAVIKASFAGFSDYCTIFVKPKATNVMLFKSSLELAVGDTFTFSEDKIIITPSDSLIKETSWASSNPNVATVKDGVVTAMTLGTAKITYTVDGVEASCEVTVKESVSSDNETGNVDVTIY